MQFSKFVVLPLAALAITACESQAEQEADMAEDQMEMQAEQSAAESGNEEAALGMTEAQLIDADLVDADGNDLGDIEQVRRNAMGTVEGLVVELEGTERYVLVPMNDLVARPETDDDDDMDQDMNVQTTQSARQLAELPDAEMPGAM